MDEDRAVIENLVNYRINVLKMKREPFCDLTGQNYKYWGEIERGESHISLQKFTVVCERANINPCLLFPYSGPDEVAARYSRIMQFLLKCSQPKLDVVEKIIAEIADL